MNVWSASVTALVLAWAATLSVIDVRQRRLPNMLTVGGAVVILAAAGIGGRGSAALLGATALGGLYLLIHLVDPAGMGGGDVKLAVALGALTGALGFAVWTLAALAAPVLTAAVGTVAVARHGGCGVPHGPSMCAASLLAAALAVL